MSGATGPTRAEGRQHWPTQPGHIRPSTLIMLAVELSKKYPNRWMYNIEVCPVAVVKMLDTQMNACETLSNIWDVSMLEAAERSAEFEKKLNALFKEHFGYEFPFQDGVENKPS